MSRPAVPERVIRNARIVAGDDVLVGCALVRDGLIGAVDRGGTSVTAAEDWSGDWLLPGLVELHTDNLEKHLVPRPGVLWNAHSAMVAHDTQCAAAGITTVLDAVVIGDMDRGGSRSRTQHAAIAALHECRNAHLLRVEHRLHLRCEVSAADVVPVFERYLSDPLLTLASVMDHTPGQRQWREMSKYRRYAERHGSLGDAEFATLIARLQDEQRQHADGHRAAIVAAARAQNVPLASHDDTEVEHVQQAHDEGVTLAEFPTTVAAAQAARAAGIGIIMGGPNLVNGGSHSGNVSADELAQRDLLDVMSSDYVPASLLQSAFLLHERCAWSMPKAIATVSRNPARAVGFVDRGEIAPGLRADVIRVRKSGGMPIVLETYCAGRRAV
jgi:alpha-D-ribose 1-methylphosphonate 5-triphosphate diphosphatase